MAIVSDIIYIYLAMINIRVYRVQNSQSEFVDLVFGPYYLD